MQCKTDDVVAVAAVELLPVLARAVHHSDPRHEVHDLLRRRVVEVVAALVAPVAVHPLEPQVAARGAPGRHVRAPTRRRGPGPAGRRRGRGTKALPLGGRDAPLSRARQVHLARVAASAHGREEEPRLAEHAEGRGRRRPSRGLARLGAHRVPSARRLGWETAERGAGVRLRPAASQPTPSTGLPARVTCGARV